VGLAVLGLILGLTLGGKGGDDSGGGGGGGDDPVYKGYNPYSIDKDSIKEQGFMTSGVLMADGDIQEVMKAAQAEVNSRLAG
jgi:hypothetical protein